MIRKRVPLIGVLLLIAAGGAYHVLDTRSTVLVLTGIVTTNDVVVSPQIAGQVTRLLVQEGDTVKPDQLIALIEPGELRADTVYYKQSVESSAAQVKESEAALRYQEQETSGQVRQAEATFAATEAQRVEAAANLENARLELERNQDLVRQGIVTRELFDQARTAYDAAKAHVDSLQEQVEAAHAALALARANAEQVAVKRSQLRVDQHQMAAAGAQEAKADVRLGYTELRAPIGGIVDVRAVRPGEVVSAAQPVVTLINPDDLWVRADVEETYIDRIRLGDHLTVRLPSGVERVGTVFFRGADAAFATQRDVSRTKRDIRTFEIRLRVDNRDRRLAVGMTAYVLLPVTR